MVFFQSSQERERHRITDDILQATHDVVTDAAVVEQMPDIAAYQRRLIEEEYYVPILSHGIMRRPKSVTSPEAIPVTTLFPGETIITTLHDVTQTPRQLKRVLAALEPHLEMPDSLSEQDRLDQVEQTSTRMMYEALSPRLFDHQTHQPSSFAHVKTIQFGFDITKDEAVLYNGTLVSRPTVLFNASTHDDITAGLTGLHEGIHVQQFVTQGVYPLYPDQQPNDVTRRYEKMRRETESYYYETLAAKALYSSSQNLFYQGNPHIFETNHKAFDEVFMEHDPSTENFYPSEALQRRLKQADLFENIDSNDEGEEENDETRGALIF